jgi:hypothetical protein
MGINFDETFAPVCSYCSAHMLIAVAAREGLVLRQFDIRTAFSTWSWRKRSSSGLRQAPSTWQGHVVDCCVCIVRSMGCAKRQGYGTSAWRVNCAVEGSFSLTQVLR